MNQSPGKRETQGGKAATISFRNHMLKTRSSRCGSLVLIGKHPRGLQRVFTLRLKCTWKQRVGVQQGHVLDHKYLRIPLLHR